MCLAPFAQNKLFKNLLMLCISLFKKSVPEDMFIDFRERQGGKGRGRGGGG